MKDLRFRYIIIAFIAFLTVSGAMPRSVSAEGPPDRRQSVAEEERGNRRKSGHRDPELIDDGAPDVGAVNPLAWQKVNGVCYNGSGAAIPGAITRGIDVSFWNDTINWAQVASSNVDFAFIRLSQGTTLPDRQYDANMRGANAAGIPAGVYLYSTATTNEQALLEAQYAIRKMNGYRISYPVVFDMESSAQEKLSGDRLSELALTFCNEIRKAGYYPMVYTNTYWYGYVLNMDMLRSCDIWLARFGDKINAPDRSLYRYSIWQATDGDGGGVLNPTKGLVKGIPVQNNVDVNFGFVDYTKIITPRMGPLSSYQPTNTSEVRKSGFVTENDGQTYYYISGVKQKGVLKIGDRYYHFAQSDGHMFRSTILYSAAHHVTCYVDDTGAEVRSAWVDFGGRRYYIGDDGYAYKGSRYVGGKYYYFDTERGHMLTDLKKVWADGGISYYGADGARLTNAFQTIEENGRQNTYYFGENGLALKNGLTKINGRRYYFYGDDTDRPGVRAESTSITIGHMTYVFNKFGMCYNIHIVTTQ